LNTGITVIGKHAVVPRGVRIGRNVKVAADVRSSDFAGRVVRSGESVEVKRGRSPARPAAAPVPVNVDAERAVAAVGATNGRGKRVADD